jgi:hypothetical protein
MENPAKRFPETVYADVSGNSTTMSQRAEGCKLSEAYSSPQLAEWSDDQVRATAEFAGLIAAGARPEVTKAEAVARLSVAWPGSPAQQARSQRPDSPSFCPRISVMNEQLGSLRTTTIGYGSCHFLRRFLVQSTAPVWGKTCQNPIHGHIRQPCHVRVYARGA